MAVARLGSRVLQALVVADTRDIVHCDPKPSNLFLPAGDLEQAKLLDFGIARRAQADWPVTRPGAALGTPLCMAPEQARDGDAVDGARTSFSLGCVLVEWAIGRLSHLHANRGGRTGTWDDTEVVELYAGVPEALRVVLDRMVALDPASRPGDAGDLSRRFLSDGTPQAAISAPVRQPDERLC